MESKSIKPFFPQKVSIDNPSSYHKYILRHYKILNVFQIEDLKGSQTSARKTRKILFNVLKRAKQVKGLQLQRYFVNYPDLTRSQVYSIIRPLRNITFLSLSLNGTNKRLLRIHSEWLRYCKSLKKFYLLVEERGNQHILSNQAHNLCHRFLRELHQTKLQVMKVNFETHTDNQNLKLFLSFNHFPSTLKDFSIYWKSTKIPFSSLSLNRVTSSLSYLPNLQSLNLDIPGSVRVLQPIVTSLEHPENLTNLDLNFYTGNNNQPDFEWIRDILKSSRQLASLKLSFDRWLGDQAVYFMSLKECPLKSLSLKIFVEDDSHLVSVGNLLDNVENLESLVLKISKFTTYEDEEVLYSLFMSLSELQYLRKLKLHFLDRIMQDIYAAPQLITLFKESLKDLHNLEELSFKFPQSDFGEQAADLINVLAENADRFKKLRLDFGAVKLDNHNMERLLYLIQKAKSLTHLHLYKLRFEESGMFNEYIFALCELKNLRILKLTEIRGKLIKSVFAEGVKKILKIRSLEKFNCTQQWPGILFGEIKDSERINVREILAKNPRLKSLNVSFDIFAQSKICKLFYCYLIQGNTDPAAHTIYMNTS